MKHAYLILAHSNFEQLTLLLKQLDSQHNDIYIHIDKKSKNVPLEKIKKSVKLSKIYLYSEYKVFWGGFSIVNAEYFLLKKSLKKKYDYYHILSGADLLIKKEKYIYDFFEQNKGYEFVHYDTDERLINDKEIMRRVKVYHFLQNYRRHYKQAYLNEFFTFLERVLIVTQLFFRIDRTKKYKDIKIKYGSQWVSITHSCAKYILTQEDLVQKLFKYTNCSDELFIQTLVYNSRFKNKLYDMNFDDSIYANMRLIDLKKRGKNGNPYIWRINDWNELKDSKCLFARKFDLNIDKEIIEKIYNYTNN